MNELELGDYNDYVKSSKVAVRGIEEEDNEWSESLNKEIDNLHKGDSPDDDDYEANDLYKEQFDGGINVIVADEA